MIIKDITTSPSKEFKVEFVLSSPLVHDDWYRTVIIKGINDFIGLLVINAFTEFVWCELVLGIKLERK